MSLVTEQLTLAERGRIPAHQKHMLELYALLLAAKRARRPREKAAALRVIQVIMFGLVLHGASYDNVYRPATLGMLPPIMQPWLAFSPMIVRDHTGFDPLDFTQLCGLLSLLPAFIVTSNRRRVSRQYAVYVVLRRWSSTATWNGVVAELRMHRQTLVTIYTTTLGLLAHHYSVLITVPDVARIIPLLPQWAANVHAFTGSTADRIVAWVDGKAVQTCRPQSPVWYAAMSARGVAQGMSANLMQQAYYNGFYGFHGIKVQHVIWSDSMVNVYGTTIRRHDSKLLTESQFLEYLSAMCGQGPKYQIMGDQAYRQSVHVHPRARTTTLRRLPKPARDARMLADKNNNKCRIAVEQNFGKHVQLYPFSAWYKNKRLFEGGESNWSGIRDSWVIQTLFTNLHTCYYGGVTARTLAMCASPPTPVEYLHNVNAGLMMAPP